MTLDKAVAPPTFVAGVGRSGTTWLCELINYRKDHRLIFEPFWPKMVAMAAPFARDTYLPPSTEAPLHLQAATAILAGKPRNQWGDRFNADQIYHRRLIKDIRANLFLAWLQHWFPAVKFVLIIRHPCAVAVSQTLSGFHGMAGATSNHLWRDHRLVADHLYGLRTTLPDELDPFEHKIAIWCVRNVVPLRQLRPENLHVVFYEDLVRDPERELRRLFLFLELEFTSHVLSACGKPSALTTAQSTVRNGRDPISNWTSCLTQRQKVRAREIVEAYGLSELYGDQATPMVDSNDLVSGLCPV